VTGVQTCALPISWIQLEWHAPITFNRVHLTFDTNMNRRVRLPLFRYPECVRDYVFEIHNGIGWTQLLAEQDNYTRRRVYTFDPVTTNRLRLTILGTNGVPAARIYEIRVYHDKATHDS
jgi:hypothetical protein